MQDDSTGFAQLTVRIKSAQRFSAYDSKGRLAAGNPEQEVSVEDFWVMERTLNKKQSNAKWRLAGRLSIAS